MVSSTSRSRAALLLIWQSRRSRTRVSAVRTGNKEEKTRNQMQRRHILLGAAAAMAAGLAGIRPSVAAAGSGAVIGLSNGYFGTEWRNQMIEGAQLQFDEYKAKGLVK